MGQTVGFVGLGHMGFPIALRMLQAGHDVVGCDIRDGIEAGFRKAGGRWARTPAEVASQVRIVFASLPTPQAVEKVALGDDGLLGGTEVRIVVDLSTTGPKVARQVADRLAGKGIVALDAPVSGGVHGAGKGTLSVMASGPKASFDEVEPLLRTFGKSVIHVGEKAGMGQTMKLINNILSATALAATCEAMALGLKVGLEPQTMLDVLNAGTGKNSATEHKMPQCVLPGVPIGFGLDLSFKDIALCVEAGEQLMVPMTMGHATRQIWHHALCRGGTEQDMMDVAKTIEQWSGVQLYGCRPGTRTD